jgi:thiamine-phosphate pyrophosphorylase
MLSPPILCYVTDRKSLPTPGGESLLDVTRSAVAAGVDWIQFREKDLSGRGLAHLAQEAVTAARGTSTRIIINDRLDVAITAGAGGVHLGGGSFPVADVVSWCAKNAPRLFIGASCHSLDDAQAAERDGAHYAFFGPIFATPSKLKYGPPQGLTRLEEVCRALRIPVLAIGGITLENVAACLRAGAAGLAAIRLFQESTDLPSLVRQLHGLTRESPQPK